MLCRMQTSMRVDTANRDALAELATELGGVTMDEALAILLFERRVMNQFAALAADTEVYQEYLAENRELAEIDIDVRD